jgi:hypothetical protein
MTILESILSDYEDITKATESKGKNFQPLSDHKPLSDTAGNLYIISVLDWHKLGQRKSLENIGPSLGQRWANSGPSVGSTISRLVNR